MGRKSRRKAERRAGQRPLSAKERERAGWKADIRGQKVGDTLADYERVATIGPIRLKEALLARHNARMESLSNLPDEFRVIALNALAAVPLLDLTLTRFGASADRNPASYVGSWIDHLAWGVDSAVAAIRLVLSGQVAGAAVLARHQMERWTNFRAFNTDTKRVKGDSSLDLIARVWSTEVVDHFGILREPSSGDGVDELPDAMGLDEMMSRSGGEPELNHEHVHLSDGTEVCPAATFGVLCDVLHAVDFLEALRWDAFLNCRPDATPADAYALAHAVADVVSLNLRAIRAALGTLANERRDFPTAIRLRTLPDRFSETDTLGQQVSSNIPEAVVPRTGGFHDGAPMSPHPVWPGLWALMPLHPMHGLRAEVIRIVEDWATLFDEVKAGRRPAGRLFRDDEFVTLAFAWHRRAAVRSALKGLEEERKLLGEKFDIRGLIDREVPYIVASEAAGLISGWLPGKEVAAAASLVATALRSAYWLWLEDDDRAMAVLRSVLEQTARMKVWRRNPDKAVRLERSLNTTPRDWLDAAGWRRLEALNRALGELVHSRVTSKWHGARMLLAELQLNVDPDMSIFTARGHCLDLVVSLVCQELIATTRSMSSLVGGVLSELFEMYGRAGKLAETDLEALLNHAWTHRVTQLGGPTFQGPAIDWESGTGPAGFRHETE